MKEWQGYIINGVPYVYINDFRIESVELTSKLREMCQVSDLHLTMDYINFNVLMDKWDSLSSELRNEIANKCLPMRNRYGELGVDK